MTQTKVSKPGRGRGRPSSEASAKITTSILEAASALFLELGFAETSLDAIALRAGVPRSTLYKRFKDKHAVLNAVTHSKLAKWSEAATPQGGKPPDLEARLTRYVTTMLVFASRDDVRIFSRMAIAASESSSRADFFGYDRMTELIIRDIVELAPIELRPRDPEKIALALMSLVAGWIELSKSEPQTREEAAPDAAWLVNLFLRGVSITRDP